MLTFTNRNLWQGVAMLLLAVFCSTGAWAQKKAAGGGNSNQIVVVSDIHVMAPSLLEDGAETQEAWTTYYAGERKMLQESAAIFDQFVDQMIALRPRVVLITGDLTKDGEMLSHEYVRDGLDRMRYNDINVFVIPGNHDFGGSGKATKFKADGTTEDAEVMSDDEFASFYNSYGYNDWDNERDPNSLSYVAEPIEGLVILAIDSHKASIAKAPLDWLCTKAKEARKAGKQVIAMMHHPLFPHIMGANLFIDTYTVDGYETVRDALIDAGVNTILTGHFHTSDIAKDWNDVEGKAVYDINTGSLISYPFDYRVLTPSNDFMTFQVATQTMTPTGMTAEDAKAWLQGRTKTIATQKMKDKAGAMAGMFTTQIDNVAEFASNLYILHTEGDENVSNGREAVATVYEGYKNDPTYSAIFNYGGITDASIYSILDDKSNYGTDKANQTADRAFSIAMPEVGPFKDNSPGTITIGSGDSWTDLPITAQYNYAVTQQVFSADEINHGKGKIWSLAFKTHTGDLKRNLTVYLTHRDYASVSLHPVTEADQVFKGEVMFTAGQWNTIYFDRPFEYDGKSSIIVTVDDNTGTAEGWGSLQNYYFYGDGGHAIARDNNKDIDPLDEASIENANKRDSYQYKAQIQFTFGEYPVPASLTVNAGDVSAEVACTLRGDATAWNVRYRKVAKEGEEEQRYVAINDLTDLSTTLTDLTPATKYEVQVQAIFPEDNLSEWSDPVIFTTACCPVEQQVEIMFALGSQYIEWFGYAVQIVDVTDEANPVEVAYLQAPSYKAYGGTVTLCCDHKYQVNWIYDADKAVYSQSYYFSLYYPQGDLIYSMVRGEAPEETAELTRFVMDCTDYCSQSPQALSVDNTTYNSATISFRSETQAGEVVYSTEAGFDPGTATPTSVNYEALTAKEDPWGGIPNNASLSLNGLEPLTKYYVRVRNVCTGGVGFSRWSDPVEVITGSRYDGSEIVSTEPVNSRSEKITFKNGGESTKVNLYYRAKVQGTPVSDDAIQTMGTGMGDGFENGSWGEGIWASGSEKPYSNILFVGGIGSNTTYSFNAGQGKTAADPEKFLYGIVEQTEETPLNQMKRLDYECMNDADKQARIKNLENDIYDRKQTLEGLYNQLTNPDISDDYKAQIEEKIAEEQKEIDELEAEKKFLEASLLSSAERQEKIEDLETDIYNRKQTLEGLYNLLTNPNLSDEEKAQIEAKIAEKQKEIDELTGEKDALESATLNDADKLQKMKDLESSLEQSEKKINELMESLQKGEITEAQYDEQIKDLNEDYFGTSDELNNLRATMSAAQNMNKDGFTVASGADTEPNAPKSRALTRADEGKKYVFFIRHSNGDGWLLVKNLTFTPNDQLNAWTVVPNVTGSEYTITDLEPETTYEVMVEPIFDSGLTGTQSPIASFTTIGEETDPVEGEFSVAEDKKVQFARGNLQHEGDMYEGKWSMAKQQYEMLGQDNIDKPEGSNSSYTAKLIDLFCWSTAKDYNGLEFFAYDEEERAKTYFQGDFADWGAEASLVSDLGEGWCTLSKDEWDYLLNERTNAANLKALATVASVQGLILLPDNWTGSAPAATLAAEEWTTLEKDGAVFLPTAGQMTQTYDQTEYVTTTTVSNDGVEGFYWTSTPFDDNAGLNAYVLNFSATNATPETDVNRCIASAVRLVKEVEAKNVEGDANSDGDIDVADIDIVIEAIGEPYELHKAADVNNDGVIDIADIDYIIERIQ